MIQTWTPDTDKPEPPDYRTVREWLRKCRDMTQAVEDQRDKIRRWTAAATQTTPNLSGMPGGGGAGDKVGRITAQIADEETKLLQMEQELKRQKDETYRRILWPLGNDLSYTSRMVDYLEGYYIDCVSADKHKRFQLVTYEQLAGRKGVDTSTVKKSMYRAVQVLSQYWENF